MQSVTAAPRYAYGSANGSTALSATAAHGPSRGSRSPWHCRRHRRQPRNRAAAASIKKLSAVPRMWAVSGNSGPVSQQCVVGKGRRKSVTYPMGSDGRIGHPAVRLADGSARIRGPPHLRPSWLARTGLSWSGCLRERVELQVGTWHAAVLGGTVRPSTGRALPHPRCPHGRA
jgi:hypothetical protein